MITEPFSSLLVTPKVGWSPPVMMIRFPRFQYPGMKHIQVAEGRIHRGVRKVQLEHLRHSLQDQLMSTGVSHRKVGTLRHRIPEKYENLGLFSTQFLKLRCPFGAFWARFAPIFGLFWLQFRPPLKVGTLRLILKKWKSRSSRYNGIRCVVAPIVIPSHVVHCLTFPQGG